MTADNNSDIITPVEVVRQMTPVVEKILQEHPGVKSHFGGENKDTTDSMQSLVRALVMAVCCIFIILIGLFGTIRHTIVVMSAIPMGLIGVVYTFKIAGQPLSFMAMLGIVALAGVVINDSIVLVNFINKIREEGENDPLYSGFGRGRKPLPCHRPHHHHHSGGTAFSGPSFPGKNLFLRTQQGQRSLPAAHGHEFRLGADLRLHHHPLVRPRPLHSPGKDDQLFQKSFVHLFPKKLYQKIYLAPGAPVRGNTFGKMLSLTSFGESHGKAMGVVLDGVPPGLDFSLPDLQNELDRRAPGKIPGTTSRQEKDQAEVLSGIFQNKTLGTPIAVIVANKDQRSEDYDFPQRRPSPGTRRQDLTAKIWYQGSPGWRQGFRPGNPVPGHRRILRPPHPSRRLRAGMVRQNRPLQTPLPRHPRRPERGFRPLRLSRLKFTGKAKKSFAATKKKRGNPVAEEFLSLWSAAPQAWGNPVLTNSREIWQNPLSP